MRIFTAPGQYLALEILYDVFRRADETIVLEDSVCNNPVRSAEQNIKDLSVDTKTIDHP